MMLAESGLFSILIHNLRIRTLLAGYQLRFFNVRGLLFSVLSPLRYRINPNSSYGASLNWAMHVSLAQWRR